MRTLLEGDSCFYLIKRRLNYILYMDINHTYLVHLVQNEATRLLTAVPKREHITPVLISLDWLPFHLRINFKVLVLVFKTWNGLASAYLTDLTSVAKFMLFVVVEAKPPAPGTEVGPSGRRF